MEPSLVPLETLERPGGWAVVLQADDTFGIVTLATVGFFGGLYAIYRGGATYRKYALVRNTPTERIRSIALGRTELEGIVRAAGELIDQPFTDGDCVYTSWLIQEYTDDPGGDDESWETIAEGVDGVEFSLESETGRRVLVDDPTDATVTLSGDCTDSFTVEGYESPSDEIAEFCERLNVSPTAIDKRRYVQEVLDPGRSAYVFGQAVEREDPTGRQNQKRIVVERDPSSGRFIVSDRSEKTLQGHYRLRSVSLVGGGLVLSTVCLGVWLHAGAQYGFVIPILGGIFGLVILFVLYLAVGPSLNAVHSLGG